MKIKEYIGRIVLTGISTAVAIGGLELFLRQQIGSTTANPFAHNPIIAMQVSEGTFAYDPELGHRLAPPPWHTDNEGERFFVGRTEMQTLNEVIETIDVTKPTILHLGDSSTSGWDSDLVTRNRFWKDVARESFTGVIPFFQYPTYADILAQHYNSINAGVPGYTSFQGARYIKQLLNEFEEKGVGIDYVTIYFGNNESVWNGNTQDKYVLPSSDNLKLIGAAKTFFAPIAIIQRVDVVDYKENIEEIIATCQTHGAQPILIQPVIPKYWHPGNRANGQEQEVWHAMYDNKGDKAIEELEKAIALYEEAVRMYLRAGTEEQKEAAGELFVQAQNLDYMVPRIKPAYVNALHEVAAETRVPLVTVQDQIPIDDRRYFVDYCHPIEATNKLITHGIEEAIVAY